MSVDDERFRIACDAIVKMARLAEPFNPRRQAETCLACAIRIALDNGSTEREAFGEIDALFTVMMERYMSIAHDEQSKRR